MKAEFFKRIPICMMTAILCFHSFGGGTVRANPPSDCKAPDNTCGCGSPKVGAGCIKVNLDMGATTPWTGSMPCALKVFADDNSPLIFTPESIYAVCGYTFKRLGNDVLGDGTTPASVVFSHPNGESVYFRFKEGESWGMPDPGIHIPMDERLMMVDAQGWAATSDPVYYDLYETDGTVRRFHATNMTDAYGKLVYIKRANGVVYTPEDMGIDIVYGPNGVRQFLTPSRLADIRTVTDGYDVVVYPLQDVPEKDTVTGLYSLPEVHTTEFLTVRLGDMEKTAVVTLRTGESEPRRHVFKYAFGDWSMTRPDGVEERKEKYIQDSARARMVSSVRSASGEVLSREELNFIWTSWGFAATNRVEGFGNVKRTTSWTYFMSGNGKGHVKSQLDQTGLLTEYAYDSADRVVSEKRSGPGMMTEVTAYSYESVDPSDVVPLVDARPRTIVKKLDGIECERTYFVYSPLTNVVERVGMQGAAYGGTNVLRTVTAFYPAVAGDVRSSLVKSVRHENGKVDEYEYALTSNIWMETVTHLHENVMEPMSGKTTRDITRINERNETLEERTEAYIDGTWHTIARERYTHNEQGKVVRRENLAGQVTTTEWDCCHKISEVQPDGSTTTWDYDDNGRMVASSRLIPLDMTNVTWLTTCYDYDFLGRETASWQTNFAAHVGLPKTLTQYDALGRVTNRIDGLDNNTTITYSDDETTQFVVNPRGATTVTLLAANDNRLSVCGTAVTPEFHSYGVSPEGVGWIRTSIGETASSPRFVKRYEDMLGRLVCEERSGCNGSILATEYSYDEYGRISKVLPASGPVTRYSYDATGDRSTMILSADRDWSDGIGLSEWRKTESMSSTVVRSNALWFVSSNVVSCSDAEIKPLVTSSETMLTGLSAEYPSLSKTIGVRGNATEESTRLSGGLLLEFVKFPGIDNASCSIYRYGTRLRTVSVSAVTNSFVYDYLGRIVASVDGQGSVAWREYDSCGRQTAYARGTTNAVSYVYDRYGDIVAITNSDGRVEVREYDAMGRLTYVGGSHFPVRYEYDIFGNKTGLTTYREEKSGEGDVTAWYYDEAAGVVTNKTFADGSAVVYSYEDNGVLRSRVWARGVKTSYSHDAWGSLVETSYSDGTASIVASYDGMGRRRSVSDAAGMHFFAYDDYGNVVEELSSGGGVNFSIKRSYDAYGRISGRTVNDRFGHEIEYGGDDGMISSMTVDGVDGAFQWSYLPGTGLKSTVTYPCGVVTEYSYDAAESVTVVENRGRSGILSRHEYEYDAVGRKVKVKQSGSAFDGVLSTWYEYDDRGSVCLDECRVNWDVTPREYRPPRWGKEYFYDDAASRRGICLGDFLEWYDLNSLNQPDSFSSFIGGCDISYDRDGNLLSYKTLLDGSGKFEIRSFDVQYDAENRPARWIVDGTNLLVKYDYMGRRTEIAEVVRGVTNSLTWFCYDDYLCVFRKTARGGVTNEDCYVWDPTEPISTRPLFWRRECGTSGGCFSYCYLLDGRKNVSEVVDMADGSVAAHYEYTAWGEAHMAEGIRARDNPWRFSCEYEDDVTMTVHYNFRDYMPAHGRWMTRDPIGEDANGSLYVPVFNDLVNMNDYLGLDTIDGLVKRAHDRCSAMIEDTKDINKRKFFQPMADDNDALPECKRALDAAVRSEQVKEAMSKFNANCELPKMVCSCCDSFKMKSTGAIRGVHGYCKPDNTEIGFCWNNYTDKAQVPFKMEQTLVHEMTHALQNCRNDKRGCLGSLRREIEARRCAGQCEGFEDCYLKAIDSSCFRGMPCNDADEVAGYAAELKVWYQDKDRKSNPDGFCKFNL